MDYQGFGNGSDGTVTLSGTDAPIDSSCSGSSGATALSATNASFEDDKIILIHQTRGTGAGNWELNIIDSYSAGTITTLFDLVNTYADSGNSQAQVIQLPEYAAVTISSTYTAKAWNGDTGGIIAYLCNGKTTISGTQTASGKGFRSGLLSGGTVQGEGHTGAPGYSTSANGNGAGGGANAPDSGHVEAGHGGGGGNASSGSSAGTRNTAVGGTGGSSSSTSDATTMTFGGSGGGGGNGWDSGSGRQGGPGGGINFILTAELEVTGSLQANGNVGGSSNDRGGAGGGGGGGYNYIVTVKAIVGINLITATAGAGGTCTGAFGGSGGNGGNGYNRIQSCSVSGTTNPGNVGTTGGHDFCQSFIHIY